MQDKKDIGIVATAMHKNGRAEDELLVVSANEFSAERMNNMMQRFSV